MLREIILISLAIAGCMAHDPLSHTDIDGTIGNLHQGLDNTEEFAVNNVKQYQDNASPVVNFLSYLLPSVLSSSQDILPLPALLEITESIFRWFKAILTYYMEVLQTAQGISEHFPPFQIFSSLPEMFGLESIRAAFGNIWDLILPLLSMNISDTLDKLFKGSTSQITADLAVLPSPNITVSTLPNEIVSTSPNIVVSTLTNIGSSPSPDLSVSASPNITVSTLPNVAVSTSPTVAVSTLANLAVTTPPNIVGSTLTNIDLPTTPGTAVPTSPNTVLPSSLMTGVPTLPSTANPTSAKIEVSTSSKKPLFTFPNIFHLPTLFPLPKFNFTF